MNRIGKRRKIRLKWKTRRRKHAKPNETAAGHAHLDLELPRTAQNQFRGDSGIDESRERSLPIHRERVGGDRAAGEKANSVQERFWRMVPRVEGRTEFERSSGELGRGTRVTIHDAGIPRSGGPISGGDGESL